MNPTVRSVIENHILKNDIDYIRARCRTKIDIPAGIVDVCRKLDTRLILEPNNRPEPSLRVDFDLPTFTKGNLIVSYRTTLHLSRIAPVFYIEHSFEVENEDPEGMSPVLDGFGGMSYTQRQEALSDSIITELQKIGYAKLSTREINEVIPGISLGPDIVLFGPQVTIEYALFRDLFEVCS